MTRLVVSVRSAAEALAAVDAGAAIVDVKEPLRGPLGAADPGTIRSVAAAVDGRVPLSAALGELVDFEPTAICDPSLRFAKFGLAQCAACPDWIDRWRRALDWLAPTTEAVGVVYADWRAAQSPPCPEVLRAAAAVGCRAVLVDTFAKGCGTLVDLWSQRELSEFVNETRRARLLSVLAGSLTPESIPAIVRLAPDYIAVRGAACRRGRDSDLDPRRVRSLALLVGGADALRGRSKPAASRA